MSRCNASLVILSLAMLASLASAVVPSYIQTCGRRNPNLDRCVMESVSKLMPQLKSGIPELEVPSIEPLNVDQIPLADLDDFKAIATDVKISGLSNFQIKFLKVDLKAQKIDIELLFPRVHLNSDYDVKAKILVPISEKGPISTTTDNVYAKASIKFNTVQRKGRNLIYFPTMTTKVTIDSYIANFLPGSDENPISQAINSVLQNSQHEIIQSMTPNIEKAISQKVLDVSNRISKHFTFDELFPDRA